MECSACAFSHQLQRRRSSAPCNICREDPRDKGYCLAADHDGTLVPVLMRIRDRRDARQLMQRARDQGTMLSLLCWSQQRHGYCHIEG